jgi:hypothetical protein
LLDRAGGIAAPEGGLVVGAQSAPEFQCVVRVQCKGEQADHHALVRLRRMPRDRQRMVAIIPTVDVGNGESGFADRGLEGHGMSIRDEAAHIAIVTYNRGFQRYRRFARANRPIQA